MDLPDNTLVHLDPQEEQQNDDASHIAGADEAVAFSIAPKVIRHRICWHNQENQTGLLSDVR